MEKNGFCDEGCGTELTFWGGVFLSLSSLQSLSAFYGFKVFISKNTQDRN